MDLGLLRHLHIIPSCDEPVCEAGPTDGNLRKLYLFELTTGLFFFLPVIVLFYIDNGLTFTEMMLLQSAFCVALMAFEVPSGYLSDNLGRRHTLMIGSSFLLAAVLLYSVGATFWQFLVAELFFAVFFAMLSGTDSALAYDTLKCSGSQESFKGVWGKALYCNLLGLALACLAGGIIGQISYRHTFYAMMPVAALALVLSSSFKEPAFPKPKKRLTFAEVLTHLRDNPLLCAVIAYSAAAEGMMHAGIWFIQPYLANAGMSASRIGAAFALVYLFSAAGSRLAARIREAVGPGILLAIPLIVSAAYMALSNIHAWWGILLFFAIFSSRGIVKVLLEDMANRPTPTKMRATVLSVKGLSERLVYAALLPIAGHIWDIYGMGPALALLGAASAAFAAVAAVWVLLLR